MASLRDAVRKQPPNKSQFCRLLQALEANLAMESAEDMSSAEISDMVETLLELVPDFSAQLELHRETPREERTNIQLLGD